jgi:hypothetical protein
MTLNFEKNYQNNAELKVSTFELTFLNINYQFVRTFRVRHFIFTIPPVCKFPTCNCPAQFPLLNLITLIISFYFSISPLISNHSTRYSIN